MFKCLIFVFVVSSFSTLVEAGADVVGRLGQRQAADRTTIMAPSSPCCFGASELLSRHQSPSLSV